MTQIFHDDFDSASAVNLEAHAPNVGSAWTKVSSNESAVVGAGTGSVQFAGGSTPNRIAYDTGVSTADAYGWFDTDERRTRTKPPAVSAGWGIPAEELVNDLEPPVVARHPAIGRLIGSLRRAGAQHAAMSGSGSAVYGLFERARDAESAARQVSSRTVRTIVTRTRSERASAIIGRPR